MNAWRHYREGAVKVRLQGLSPERFFNLCGQGEVEIWKISCAGAEYEFYMTVRGFFSCRPFVRKSGVRLKILEKTGLPFFLYRNRKRGLWALGFLLFFLLLYLLSLFVWEIDFQGNLRHSDNELMHYLETEEIRCGMRKKQVDCEWLEGQIRNNFPDITWVSARVEGTRLYIHVKENQVVLTVPKKDETPCDLVADAGGEILSMVVRSGTPAARPGDVVEPGQVLVSGRLSITDDSGQVVSERMVRSDADIILRRERTEEKELSLWHKKRVFTGRQRRGLFVQAFGKDFTLLMPDFEEREWSYTAQTFQARIGKNFYLPFFGGTIRADEQVSYWTKYTEEELSAMAEEYRRETEAKLIEKGVQIIENNVTILDNDSACLFRLEMITEEPAGSPAPIETGMEQEQPSEGES